MKRITSRLHKKQRNSLLFLGLAYTVFGIIELFLSSNPYSSWIFLVTGLIALAVLTYYYYSKALFAQIGWDEEVLLLKRVGEKAVFFKLKNIKSLKLTDKSLTVNAGMEDGQLIDLDYFRKKDIALFKQDFVFPIQNKLSD